MVTRETPEQLRAVIDLDLNGCYWMAQACGRVLEPVSSIMARVRVQPHVQGRVRPHVQRYGGLIMPCSAARVLQSRRVGV